MGSLGEPLCPTKQALGGRIRTQLKSAGQVDASEQNLCSTALMILVSYAWKDFSTFK